MEAVVTSLNATFVLVLHFCIFVVSNCRQGLVTQEAVKLEFCRTFCLSDDFGVNSVLKCIKTNLICVKTGAYASGYRIPHLSILCCFWLVQCSVY